MVNLDDVSVFIAVAEKQNFSAAARELNISPSAVSKRINRLEHQLRAKLINRSPRRISLSAAGSAFFKKCADIRPIVEDATRAVQSLHSAPGGHLRVHASTGLALKLVTPLIPDFLAQNPNISMDLITHVHGPAVLTQDIDIFLNTSDTADKTLGSRDLGVSQYAICASTDYLDRCGTPETPDDLPNHNCLLYNDYGRLIDTWTFRRKDRRYDVKVSGTFISNNSAVLYETMMKGMGIALLPVYAVIDDVKSGRLQALFVDQLTFGKRFSAYYPRSPHLPINVRLFLDFVSKRLRTLTLDGSEVSAAKSKPRAKIVA